MNHPDNFMLYVNSPEQSAVFYSKLFDIEPAAQSPGFVLFILETGVKLALWSSHDVSPAPNATSGGFELSIRADGSAEVDEIYEKWRQFAPQILMEPSQLAFGWSFVIADSDGHRVRVYALDGDA